jgi:hypothetical protein
MKRFGMIIFGVALIALIAGSCKTPAGSDGRSLDGYTGLSDSAPGAVRPDGPVSVPTSSGRMSPAALPSASPPVNDRPVDAEPQQGELEMAALAQAYPQRIEEVDFREGDWAVRIEDTWYHWAHGRLLPDTLRDRWEEFASYRFYRYSLDLPPIRELDEESKLRIKRRLEQSVENPPKRHQGFLADLYSAPTRGATEARIVTVQLMGFDVRVHQQIAEALEAVNADLEVLISTDPGVRRFVEGLKGLAGYNWREIAGTRSRSYHSYGIAIDLAPRSFGGKHTYWRWALPQTEEFYSIPYERRWMVPQQIVKAFEQRGFVWGGKWLFFDTMHFEYRPEILVLAESAGIRR